MIPEAVRWYLQQLNLRLQVPRQSLPLPSSCLPQFPPFSCHSGSRKTGEQTKFSETMVCQGKRCRIVHTWCPGGARKSVGSAKQGDKGMEMCVRKIQLDAGDTIMVPVQNTQPECQQAKLCGECVNSSWLSSSPAPFFLVSKKKHSFITPSVFNHRFRGKDLHC